MHIYNDPKLKELGTPLFQNIYATRMRYKDTVSTDTVVQRGIFTTGDASYDDGFMNDMVDNYLKICDMVGYFNEEIGFSLRVRSDGREIYEIISRYLHYWCDVLESTMHPIGVPLNDLMTLDLLARRCYTHSYDPNARMELSPGTRMFTRNAISSPRVSSASPAGVPAYPSVMERISVAISTGGHTIVE